MRLMQLGFVVAVLVGSQHAARACPDADWIPDWVGYGLGAGLVGGYAYGTGYFIDQDLSNDRRDRDYVIGELAFNGLATAAFGAGTVDAISNGSAAVIPLAALTALHGTLTVNAARRVEVGSPKLDSAGVVWTLGSVYALETLVFVEGTSEQQSRTYGAVELAVQAPIAAGLGYLAYDRMHDGSTGSALLFGGMAAVSGALAVHGLRTLVMPRETPKLDFGFDLAPTVVDDGHEVAPGLGASGTF